MFASDWCFYYIVKLRGYKMTVKEFMIKYGRCCTSYFGLTNLFPSLVCKDGSTMSVQASEYHMSIPKFSFCGSEINNYGAVEVYTKIYDDDLSYYLVSEHTYGRVPCEILDIVIKRHGGIDIKAVNILINEQKQIIE